MKVKVTYPFFDVTPGKVYNVVVAGFCGEVEIVDDVGDKFTLFDDEYQIVED